MERRGQVEAVLTVTLTDYHREEQQNRIESNVIELTRYYRGRYFSFTCQADSIFQLYRPSIKKSRPKKDREQILDVCFNQSKSEECNACDYESNIVD